MFVRCLTVAVSLGAISTVADARHHHRKHRHAHGKHVHGEVDVQIAVSKNKAEIAVKGPSESFFGFEHDPKTAAEKAAVKAGEEIVRKKSQELFSFAKAEGCEYDVEEFHPFAAEAHKHGHKAAKKREHHRGRGRGHAHDDHHGKKKKSSGHFETHIHYDVKCKSNLESTKINIGLKKAFSRIEKIKVVAVSGRNQKSATITKDMDSIQL